MRRIDAVRPLREQVHRDLPRALASLPHIQKGHITVTNERALEGPTFYDAVTVSAIYLERREAGDHANNLMELPHILELAGPMEGREVADLGCGDARFGLEVLEHGAARYWGLEGASTMVMAAATALKDHVSPASRGAVEHGRIEDWRPDPGSFDVVVSRMALHYLADIGPTFRAAARALRPGGRFVFSVEHPVVTSCYDAADPDDFPEHWLVRDYFTRGARKIDWLGATSLKFHRTIQDHLEAIDAAGLRFVALREGDPLAVQDQYDAVRRRRRHVPMYLIMAADRPA